MFADDSLGFALIVGGARSGTTLMRLLLDAHPDIGCPAEAGLPALMSHMANVWATIDADFVEDAPTTDPGERRPEERERVVGHPDNTAQTETPPNELARPLPESARGWIRATTETAMRRYCSRSEKRLYVDKSLDAVYNLEIVRQVFPHMRCVLTFRHVMDTIASGIEASPWGFNAYGYTPYVQANPANTVAALARYWLDHVSAALDWEAQHPETCLRVRYEDLVASPEGTVLAVQRFLGVTEDPSVLQAAFARPPARGPGDYKVEHTTRVHALSVGQGKRVPVDMLPPPLLAAINEKLATLGYDELDRSWNTAERGSHVADDNVWVTRLQDLMASATPPRSASLGAVAMVAEDHAASRWVVDCDNGSITQGDGEVDAVLTGTTQDLVLMVTGAENLGALMRSGRVRHVVANNDEARQRDLPREATRFIALLQSCVAQEELDRAPQQLTEALADG